MALCGEVVNDNLRISPKFGDSALVIWAWRALVETVLDLLIGQMT